MYCPNCGTDNKEGSIYCNLCQEPLERYVPPSPQGMPPYPGQPAGTAAVPPPAAVPAGPASPGSLVPPGAGFGQPAQPYAPPAQPYAPPGAGYAPPAQPYAPPGAGYAPPAPPPYAGQAYAGGMGVAGPPPPAYPGQPAYANYGPYPVVIAQQSTPGEATAALVLGIIGLLFGWACGIPIICSILAIVFGIKARNMIDAGEGFLGGRGMATAGLVLGIVGMGINTVLLILTFALEWYDIESALTLAALCPLLPPVLA